MAETAFTTRLRGDALGGCGQRRLPLAHRVLSVQSDESRHISNGFGTLLMALGDERNHQLLSVTSATPGGTTTALWTRLSVPLSSTVPRTAARIAKAMREMWRRWIYDDYYRSYLIPPEKYGLKIPTTSSKSGTASGTGVTCIRWPSSSPRVGRSTMAHRPDDRRRLRMVRAQVPRLVQRVQAVGALQLARSPTGRSPSRTPGTCIRTAAGPAWSRV